jgi:hypothetical protein
MAWELAGLVLIASLAATIVAVRRRRVRKGRLAALRRAVSSPALGGGERYLCPAHPHVRAASPVRCPNCQRTLVRQPASERPSGTPDTHS